MKALFNRFIFWLHGVEDEVGLVMAPLTRMRDKLASHSNVKMIEADAHAVAADASHAAAAVATDAAVKASAAATKIEGLLS